MSKKVICVALGAMLVALSFAAEAQQLTKIPRIGFLGAASASALAARIEAFRQGLASLATWREKHVIEWRSAEGKLGRLPALAAKLVRLKVDVIVTTGPAPTRPAKEAASTITLSWRLIMILLETVRRRSRATGGTLLGCPHLPRR
jgi:putative ABC transport system substrate-binding protein